MNDAVRLLSPFRNDDGGFGPRAGAPSEPESTAMAVLALGDGDAAGWLGTQQRDDGGFGAVVGSVRADCTAVASLALQDPAVRERALDHLVAFQAAPGIETDVSPYDLSVRGWSWTEGTFAWTEPTAWGLLALRVGRPEATDRIDDAVGVLRDRQCVSGGWNYGTRVVYGVELPPFVETTALAVLALQGHDDQLTGGGLGALRAGWRAEAAGLLSLATACAAFRVVGDPVWKDAREALVAATANPMIPDTVALSWAAIALGDGWERLQP